MPSDDPLHPTTRAMVDDMDEETCGKNYDIMDTHVRKLVAQIARLEAENQRLAKIIADAAVKEALRGGDDAK